MENENRRDGVRSRCESRAAATRSDGIDSDFGVVPLLSANMEYALAPRWTALVDFDGLVSPQGRAIDAAAKIRYDLTDNWYVSAGYRVFEGGVDNDERFAFAWYNFAVVSVGARF